MNIYTYFNPVPGIDLEGETRLILLWQKNWRAHGFTPIVLNEYIARMHPYFEEYDKAVRALPTVNPPEYERNCYIRHLAMAQAGGGILSDYDVFNRNLPSAQSGYEADALWALRFTLFERTTPSMVGGIAADYFDICERFASFALDDKDVEQGRPHTSDQNALVRMIDRESVLRDGERTIKVEDPPLVKIYTSPGWEEARVVHFATGAMSRQGKLPKWKHVEQLIGKASV